MHRPYPTPEWQKESEVVNGPTALTLAKHRLTKALTEAIRNKDYPKAGSVSSELIERGFMTEEMVGKFIDTIANNERAT